MPRVWDSRLKGLRLSVQGSKVKLGECESLGPKP